VAVILLGAVVGVLFWKRRQQSMVSEENGISRDTFQGAEMTFPDFGHDNDGAAMIRKPAFAVLQSAEMQDTNVADGFYGLGNSDVRVSFLIFFRDIPPYLFCFNSLWILIGILQDISVAKAFDPHSWTVNDVGDWLQSNNIPGYIIQTFQNERINGKSLLLLPLDNLGALGVTAYGERLELAKLISDLKEEFMVSAHGMGSGVGSAIGGNSVGIRMEYGKGAPVTDAPPSYSPM
jgi:hypothetical protein